MNMFVNNAAAPKAPDTPTQPSGPSVAGIANAFNGESWSQVLDVKYNGCRFIFSKKDNKLRVQAFNRYGNCYHTKQYSEADLKVLSSDTLLNEYAPIDLDRFLLSLASCLPSAIEDDGRVKITCTHGSASQSAFAARTLFILPAAVEPQVEVVRVLQ